MEIWTDKPRQFRSKNIGPAGGEHLLCEIDAPGLYVFVSDNAEGKSEHLRHLLKLQDEKALRSIVSVTDGEMEATLELEPAKVTFRKSPSGAIRVTSEGIDELPEITEADPAIEELIHAGHRKTPAARAKARLAALLEYAPVEATPARLDELAQTLRSRSWSEAIPTKLRESWERVRGHITKGTSEPMRTAEEIRAALDAGSKDRGPSILDDHDALQSMLNAIGLTGEKIVEKIDAELERRRGRLSELLERVVSRRDPTGDAGLSVEAVETELRDAPGTEDAIEAARQGLQEARTAHGQAQESRAARRAEEARRAELSEERGPRPDVEAAAEAAEAATAKLQAARETLEAAQSELAAAQQARESATASAESMDSEVQAAWDRAQQRIDELAAAVWTDEGRPAYGTDLKPYQQQVGEALDAVREAVRTPPGAGVEEAEARLQDATEAAELKAQRVTELEAERDAAQQRLIRVRTDAEAWDRTAALLDQEISGATDADVEATEQAVGEAVEALETAKDAASYTGLREQVDVAVDLMAAVEEAAKDYREAAQDSWAFLGLMLTDQLDAPWLQVDGTDLYLGFVAGRLNDDPELLAQVRTQAEQAAAAADSLSPVALPRFILETVRASAEVEWRLMDDERRVSTGELHAACLSLMLQKRGKLGGILVVPDRVLWPLDGHRLQWFDEQLRERGVVCFSERPWRRGDPEGLFVERVADVGVEAEPATEQEEVSA